MWKTTRGMSYVIMPVLAAAWVILYWFPDRTKQLWAWTMKPSMTAITMGAGYMGGAWLFFRVTRNRESYRLVGVLVGAFVFTTLLGVATAIHWDKFNHVHVSFWAWVVLYVTTPLLLPLLYVKNRVFDPGVAGPEDAPIPGWVRISLTALGGGQLLFALALFVRPSLFQDEWPWKLTTLSARSLAGFASFPAVAYLCFAFERRWSALRWPFETAIAGVTLIAVGAARSTGDFKGGGVTRAWTVGLLVGLVFLVTVRLVMERRVAKHRRPASVA